MSEATAYSQEIEQQRKQRETRLLEKPTNWFTLAGLFPLKPGENSFGKGTNNSIVLDLFPADVCGRLILEEDGWVLEPGEDLPILINGQPVAGRVVVSENVAGPDLLEAGRLTMCLIRRGGEPYLRVWDRESPLLKNFPGLSYYPVD
ncbi:MAG TPA: FHA domain-containing protein, partial [Anaerolineaceae bacterium]|nr:FHA domain-containing protein [Anaerolineaceae bacterium]